MVVLGLKAGQGLHHVKVELGTPGTDTGVCSGGCGRLWKCGLEGGRRLGSRLCWGLEAMGRS